MSMPKFSCAGLSMGKLWEVAVVEQGEIHNIITVSINSAPSTFIGMYIG